MQYIVLAIDGDPEWRCCAWAVGAYPTEAEAQAAAAAVTEDDLGNKEGYITVWAVDGEERTEIYERRIR